MSTLAPIQAAAKTDRGQVRDHNEDYILQWEPSNEQEEERNGWLYIVADGVGGADAGEVASKFASERMMAHYLNNGAIENQGQRLIQAMHAANSELRRMAAERDDNKRMATTMVAVTIADDLAYIGNVGDSRAYHWRQHGMRQITKDQSLVAKLVEEGAITEAEATIHPHRNVILYSIGSEKTPQIDLYEVPLALGDKLILCSDGLTRHVSDQEISDIVAEEEIETAVATLVDLANRRGGQDNITVSIINYGSEPESTSEDIELATTVKTPVVATKVAVKETSQFLWPFTIFLSVVEAIMIIFVWLNLRI